MGGCTGCRENADRAHGPTGNYKKKCLKMSSINAPPYTVDTIEHPTQVQYLPYRDHSNRRPPVKDLLYRDLFNPYFQISECVLTTSK